MTLIIDGDERTVKRLERLSEAEGRQVDEVAARLLTPAVRTARAPLVFDLEALRTAYAEFEDEEVALAESGLEERAQLLADEDSA